MNKVIAIVGSLSVLIAVVFGLVAIGSPKDQRFLRFDERRVNDLRTIANSINLYWGKSNQLPENLEQLVNGQRLSRVPVDPETKTPYQFNKISENAYRLCAEFSKPLKHLQPSDFWDHDAGRHCYDLDAIEPPNYLFNNFGYR